MCKQLLSLGLDVGTSTTCLILSRLQVQNTAGSFSVPKMQITGREILYQSPVYFTPLIGHDLVDGAAIRAIVEAEYRKAGINRKDVDTGAVIITGETSRKENARAVLAELSGFAGDFVVATAGPDLESILAAKGAGAVHYSQKTGKTLLHIDIGGGTSNLALIREGNIVATGCVNVGGRLIKLDKSGCVSYISPVLQGITSVKIGDTPSVSQLEEVVRQLTQVLEMAAGLLPPSPLLARFMTQEVGSPWQPPPTAVICFSGGVAACIGKETDPLTYGDLGPLLAKAIVQSRLCQGEYLLGQETLRATVIGAGSHSTQLSGSTVFYKNVQLPIQNLPVAAATAQEQTDPEAISRLLHRADGQAILYCPGYSSPNYLQVKALAQAIYHAIGDNPTYICTGADMAKALGHCLSLLQKPDTPCLCIDGPELTGESFLDIGNPIGPALPVIIKTLVLQS